ncbi:MAG TPA: alpha-amylase family glycosyl hydrolase [Anaerolineae bacterium]|nr:alpha-amylase family glycosyl hydrolase [Anaerolineae bacterium]
MGRWRWLWIMVVGLLVGCGGDAEVTPAGGEEAVEVTAEVTAEVVATATAEMATFEPKVGEHYWWNDRVFYEIFVRSFYDSDGDGVGDLVGLIEKLDYLNDGDPTTDDDLGVTGIWLMPIMESPSYHGYDVVDYYRIDEEYGTQADFLRFMEEARARDIKVVVDLVINHTGSGHPWFQQAQDEASPYRDYYVWAEEPIEGQEAYWHQRGGGDYYYAYFWGEMPDLNYRNEAVTEGMYEVTRYWLEEMGVDGFRMDAIKHLIEVGRSIENTDETHEWLEAYHQFYKGINPEALTVGEVWSTTDDVAPYVEDEMDIAFDFELAEGMLESSFSRRAVHIERAQAKVQAAYPLNQFATFLANHDQERTRSRLFNDEQAKLAAALQMTFGGVPFIYYGEEIGMQGKKPDENLRRPMQWSPEAGVGFTTGTPWREPFEDYDERHVAGQTADSESLLSYYRGLIRLRGEHEALRRGDWVPVMSDNRGVYAFLRYTSSERLLIVVNFNKEAVETYQLEMALGPLTAVEGASLVWGEGEAVAPIVTETGGFVGYRPLALPAETAVVINLE